MPPRMTDAERRLLSAYQEAALRLERALRSGRRRTVILQEIDALIAMLDELTGNWIQQELPLRYKEGSAEAIERLRKLAGFSAEIDEKFGTVHREAVQQLAEDATFKFANALSGVRESSRSILSKAIKQELIGELIAEEIEGTANPSKQIKQILEDQKLIAVRTPTRTFNLEHYSSMLTHTVLADAHNTGASMRYLSNGVQYGRIIERSDAPDKTCQWMRGKVVWLGDRRLLNPYHPFCMGGLEPVLGVPDNPIMSSEDPRVPGEVRKMLTRR